MAGIHRARSNARTARGSRLGSVLLPGLLLGLLLGGSSACGRSPAPQRRSVLLVTLDTLRPDALGCYGGPRGVSPVLDRLASEGVLYEQARTVTPLTLPAHASMMTGLYPCRHTVRGNGPAALPAAARTLAERAQDGGYRTAAFVSAVVLGRTWGLDQGFASYDEPPPPAADASPLDIERRAAPRTVAAARAWLAAGDADAPFFLWVHLFDAHQPNDPPRRLLERARGNPYWAEVARMDEALGALLEDLRTSGALAHTLVVVVADHGESFGEHGEQSHGTYLYDSTLAVPLIVRYPDGYRAGKRSAELVSVADLHPTLIEAMDLGEPGDVDGISLFHRRVPPDRGIYFESYFGWINYGWSPVAGWMVGTEKYLHSPTPELYDLRRDPAEERNLADSGARTARFRQALDEVLARPPIATELRSAGADEDVLADLRQLGYAGSFDVTRGYPKPTDPTDRPSPFASREEKLQIDWAYHRDRAGAVAEAIAGYEQIRAANPNNALVRERLLERLVEQQRDEEALAVCVELVALEPSRADVRATRAMLLERLDRLEEAVRAYERAIELDPADSALELRLSRLLGRLERRAEVDAAAKPAAGG